MTRLRETDNFPAGALPRPKRLLKHFYSSVIQKLFYDPPRKPGIRNTKRKNILIVRTDGLGDLILAIPILKYIKKAHRKSHICLLTRMEWEDLFQDCPYIDEIIPLNLRRYRIDIFYRLRFLRSLRRRSFELAIHPVYSRECLSDEVFCSSRAEEKIGIDGDLSNMGQREKLINDRYYSRIVRDARIDCSEIERNRYFTEQLLGESIVPKDFRPELWLTESDRAGAQKLLKEMQLNPREDVIIVIFPGASWHGKEWDPDCYAKVADRLVTEYGAKVVICGAKSDLAAATSVGLKMAARSVNLAGRVNLRELAAILESCSLFIGNDTGPLHIAVAVGIPTLGIVGGGHFGRFYPYGDPNKHRSAFKKMDCYWCNWNCIYPTIRCIREIPVSGVWDETQQMMESLVLPARDDRTTRHTRWD